MVAAETVVTFAASCTDHHRDQRCRRVHLHRCGLRFLTALRTVTITSIIFSEASRLSFVRSTSWAMHFSFSDKNFSFFDIMSTSCVALRPWSTPCVALRPTRSHSAQRRCALIVDGRGLPTSQHASTPWRYRVLLVANVGQLDDNLSINLGVSSSSHCSPCAVACLSFLARLTSNRSISRGPLTSSPAFTFCASARTFTFFLNLCCSGSLCQTVPVAFDRSHCLQLVMLFSYNLSVSVCFPLTQYCVDDQAHHPLDRLLTANTLHPSNGLSSPLLIFDLMPALFTRGTYAAITVTASVTKNCAVQDSRCEVLTHSRFPRHSWIWVCERQTHSSFVV